MRRASVPLVGGRTFRRETMSKKTVVQHSCDRCPRVWYLDPEDKTPERKLALNFEGLVPKELGREPLLNEVPEYVNFGAAGKYECLCDGCAKTVAALVKQIVKEFKPRERKAKKKDDTNNQGTAGQGNPQPTGPSSITAAAPASSNGSATPSVPPAPASAGASSGAAGTRPAPSAPPHPRR